MIGSILFPAGSLTIVKIVTFIGVIAAFITLAIIVIVVIVEALRKKTERGCMHKSAGQ